ncbi:MAG: ribosome maturation factor RimP [Bacteroidota bacterium]
MSTVATTDSLTDTIRRLAEAAVAEVDPAAYVVDVEVRGYQGSRVVSVYVDTDDGIVLDKAAAVSRLLSAALDHEDLVKGRYRLDVSSPGADRPLTQLRQLNRHVGRTMRVTFTSADGSVGSATGDLTGTSAEVLTLALPDAKDPLEIPVDRFVEAVVQLPW